MYNKINSSLRIFVINLKDHQEKKMRMKKILNDFSLKYEFYSAFDGRSLKISNFKGYDDFKRKLFLGRSLFPSELGALESNRLIYKKMIKENIKIALILEDDIDIHKNFEINLLKILNLKYDWDIIRFLNSNKLRDAYSRNVISLGNNVFLKRYPKLYGGCHAYLININGAKKMLKLTNNFYQHIDLIMGQTWINNLNSLICYPGYVNQVPELNVSPNDHPRFIKKKKSILGIYLYSRFLFKLYESFCKWLHYIYKAYSDNQAFKKSKKLW